MLVSLKMVLALIKCQLDCIYLFYTLRHIIGGVSETVEERNTLRGSEYMGVEQLL